MFKYQEFQHVLGIFLLMTWAITWEQREFDEVFVEKRDKTERENEDTLLSCAINGIYLNSELFGHFRGATTIGYLKVNKNDFWIPTNHRYVINTFLIRYF